MEQAAIPIGDILRDVGMARTLAAEPTTWIARALEQLERFAALPEWSAFAIEDFRAWYIEQGYPPPHSHKVWGALGNTAARAGVIRFTGRVRNAASAKTHSHKVAIWEAA